MVSLNTSETKFCKKHQQVSHTRHAIGIRRACSDVAAIVVVCRIWVEVDGLFVDASKNFTAFKFTALVIDIGIWAIVAGGFINAWQSQLAFQSGSCHLKAGDPNPKLVTICFRGVGHLV